MDTKKKINKDGLKKISQPRLNVLFFPKIIIIFFVRSISKNKKLWLKISNLSIIVTYYLWRGRLYETYQFCMNEEHQKLRKALGLMCSVVFPSKKESTIILVFFYCLLFRTVAARFWDIVNFFFVFEAGTLPSSSFSFPLRRAARFNFILNFWFFFFILLALLNAYTNHAVVYHQVNLIRLYQHHIGVQIFFSYQRLLHI